MLDRTSSCWNEGGYPPIAHKWGERGLVWVRAPKIILHRTRTTHTWVVPNALTLPVRKASARNKGILSFRESRLHLSPTPNHYLPSSGYSHLPFATVHIPPLALIGFSESEAPCNNPCPKQECCFVREAGKLSSPRHSWCLEALSAVPGSGFAECKVFGKQHLDLFSHRESSERHLAAVGWSEVLEVI